MGTLVGIFSSVATVAIIEASAQDDIGCRKAENIEFANS